MGCLFVACTVYSLVACSSEPDPSIDAGVVPDAGTVPPPEPELFHDAFVTWVLPAGQRAWATSADSVQLSGVAVGEIGALEVILSPPSGPEETHTLEVRDSFVTEPIDLGVGDQRVELRARVVDGPTVSDVVTITRNVDLDVGPVTATPGEVFSDEIAQSTLITVPISGDLDWDIDTVDLISADGSSASLLSLNDDGVAGDVQADDGIYSGQRIFAADGEGDHALRVRVKGVDNAWTALSGATTITVLSPISNAQIDQWLESLDRAEAIYDPIRTGTEDIEAAISALVEQLRDEPNVVEADVDASGYGAWWLMDSGLEAGLSDGPDGHRGAGSMVSDTRVVLYNPWEWQFLTTSNGLEAQEAVGRSQCPELGPVTHLLNADATVENFKTLHNYGVIVIDSHAGYARDGQIAIILDEEVKQADLYDPVKRYKHEARMGRLRAMVARRSRPGKRLYGVTPKFIAYHNRSFHPNSIMYVGACYSTANQTMARAFLQNGGGVFAGYTHSVSNAYSKGISHDFFNRLVEGYDVLEAWDNARRRNGQRDPTNSRARFSLVPSSSDITMSIPCSGHTRIFDVADYTQGSGPGGIKVQGEGSFVSADQIVVSPFNNPKGNVYIMKSAIKQCSYHYKWGDPVSPQLVRAGHGILHEEYEIPINPYDYDPETRVAITKLIVDKDKQTVKFTPIVEGARYDQDDWVDQLSEDEWGTFRERGHCALEGGALSWPGGNSVWAEIEISAPNVSITDDKVSGNYNVRGEYGTALISFEYELP